MIHLDHGDRRPLYEQIKEKFKELIMSGAVKEGEKIPSVRELANMLAINPNTIQHAYKELEDEGFIYSQRARGSFVAPVSMAQGTDYTESLYKSWLDAATELCYRGEPLQTLVAELERIYKAAGKEKDHD